MKSKGLWGKKFLDVDVRESDVGLKTDDHVIVKVHACGICGTDINFVRDWDNETMPLGEDVDRVPLGHEIAAEVIEVGKNVTSVAPGDRVIVEDCTMCGVCENCKKGHPEFCRNMYNMEGQPGMGQYMSVRYNCLDKFEDLDYVSACLTEPLAVCFTAVLNAEVPLGGSVAVLGSGPLGLMSAKLAKLNGAGFVAITDLPADTTCRKARLAAATEKFGCDLAIEVGKQDVEQEIKARCPNGVDRVIVTSPPKSLYDALKIIRFGGIITFMGLHFGGDSEININVNDLVFNKITLRPTFAEPAINFPASNRILKDGLIDANAVITHKVGLDGAKDIMNGIIEGSEPVIKAVVLPNG